ncbi:MAG: hypothetical protein OEW00_08315 [candidate division Zixibacteria bacterium]|nr:hypothetical protein [candidate division Zixibacteria bacterium]
MLSGLERLLSRRAWSIDNVTVWGIAGLNVVEFLSVESVEATDSILYNSVAVDEDAQEVRFTDLFDRRGNALPSEIKKAVVLVQPKDEFGAFTVGAIGNESFKIARDPNAPGPVVVDLFIVEMGE